jgi:hypothetical protein
MVRAGLPQILGLAGTSKSYAERLFKFPTIGALDEQDAVDAIVNPAKREGVGFERAAVQQILKVTERYPYFCNNGPMRHGTSQKGTRSRPRTLSRPTTMQSAFWTKASSKFASIAARHLKRSTCELWQISALDLIGPATSHFC